VHPSGLTYQTWAGDLGGGVMPKTIWLEAFAPNAK
jgi:hypothetical protein